MTCLAPFTSVCDTRPANEPVFETQQDTCHNSHHGLWLFNKPGQRFPSLRIDLFLRQGEWAAWKTVCGFAFPWGTGGMAAVGGALKPGIVSACLQRPLNSCYPFKCCLLSAWKPISHLTFSGQARTWTSKWPTLGIHTPCFMVFSLISLIKSIKISTAPLLIISLRNLEFPEINLMAPMQYKKASVLACRASLLSTSSSDSVKKDKLS